jgi:hypothetical protein
MSICAGLRPLAILLVLLFCVTCKDDPAPAKSTTQKPDEGNTVLKSNAWKNYKETWGKIDALKKAGSVDSLFSRIDGMEADLDGLFSDDTDLVNDLLMIIRERLIVRDEMLHEQRGRPPQPNWVVELQRTTNHLAAEYRVLKRFTTMGLTDPWIKATLIPDLRLYTEIVAQGIEDVRSETPPAAKTNDINTLLDDADATLKRTLVLLEEFGI